MFTIKQFNNDYFEIWDDFIKHESINGSFLQSRTFLSYHKEKFKDISLMIFKKRKLVAIFPAAVIDRIVISHPGTTFGGIIFSKEVYKTESVLEIIKVVEDFYTKNYSEIIIKQQNNLYNIFNDDILDYIYYYCGYKSAREINTYINLKLMKNDIDFSKNWSSGQRENLKKALSSNLHYEFIHDKNEIFKFYKILLENLEKYNTQPVHTFDEIMDLYTNKIPNNIEFCVIKNQDNDFLAGAMLFKFEKANVVHTQYLAQDYKYNSDRPMTFLYYSIINYYKNLGYKYLTWGISTEDRGRTLNKGLVKYKESFNSSYSVNRTYSKNFIFRLEK